MNNKNCVAIVCSRPNSARLPGKVFKKIAGYNAIEHILQRISKTFHTVIALPYNLPKSDFDNYKTVVHNFKSQGCSVSIFQGSPESPLHRMGEYLLIHPEFEYVARITHDDILIDAQSACELLAEVKSQGAGYGTSDGIIEGAGIEIIRRGNLIHASTNTKRPTEFVSYFVRGQGLPFPKIVKLPPRQTIFRNYRLTLDYQEDLTVLDIVLRRLTPFISNDTICAYLDQHSYILQINRLPELSVYTCAYNAGAYLREAVESVLSLSHTYDDFEYTVIDDCSVDETPEILARYAGTKLKMLINETNLGLASTSNRAIDVSRGKYLLRVDADDILLSAFIPNLINKIKSKNAAIIYPAYSIISTPDYKKASVWVDPRFHTHAGCALMERAALNQERFKDGLRHWDSKELYSRMQEHYPIEFSDEITWLYRDHDKSMSKTNLEEREKIHKQLQLGEIDASL